MDKLKQTTTLIITSIKNICFFWYQVLSKSLLTTLTIFLPLLAPIEIIRLLLYIRIEGIINIASFFSSYYIESIRIYILVGFFISILHHSSNEYFIQEKWATIDTWKHVKKTVRKHMGRGSLNYEIELMNQKPHAIRNFIVEVLYLEMDGRIIHDRTHEAQYIRDTAPRLSYINEHILQENCNLIDKNGGTARIALINQDIINGEQKYKIACYQKDNPENPNHFMLHWYEFTKNMRVEFYFVAEINLDGVISYGSRPILATHLSAVAVVNNGKIKIDFRESHLPHYLT